MKLRWKLDSLSSVSDEPVQTDSQYHSASVGKTMNATVFGMLVDEGRPGGEIFVDDIGFQP